VDGASIERVSASDSPADGTIDEPGALGQWIADLRARLDAGDLARFGPIDVGDGTGLLAGAQIVRIMLADLDHLDGLPPVTHEWLDIPERRRALLDAFRQLRDRIG
jgi:hypothetical protein